MPLMTLAITSGTTIMVSRRRKMSPRTSSRIAVSGLRNASPTALAMAPRMYSVRWLAWFVMVRPEYTGSDRLTGRLPRAE